MNDRIFFDDEYVQDLIRIYGQVLLSLDGMRKKFAVAESQLHSASDSPHYRETFERIRQDLDRLEEDADRLRRIMKEITAVYHAAEEKNIRLVDRLSGMCVMHSNGGFSSEAGHDARIDRMLAGMRPGRSSLLYGFGIQHEMWLAELAKRG